VKDQLVTAIGAVLACLALYLLMFSSSTERAVTRPISEEPGRNGYLALRDWLDGEDVAVISWRERFDSLLEDEALSATGNVMLTTLPHRQRLRLTEHPPLRAWIERGNTLLLTAALDDSPEWTSLTDGTNFFNDLQAITGLEFVVASETRKLEAVDTPLSTAVAPETALRFEPLPHPLMEGVRSLSAFSDGLSSLWRSQLRDTAGPPVLRLAVESDFRTPAIYQLPVGQGFIFVVLSTSMLSNEQIAEADAGRFVANIIARHMDADGFFIFDDMHQGLSTLYDPAAFLADKRLHHSIIFLMAAWFLYLVGSSNRVAPVRPERGGPSQATLLAGIGGFMARRLDRVETGRLLFEDWFRDIRRHRGVRDTAPPWQVLAATPTLSKDLLTRLQDAWRKLENDVAVDLVELNNLIIKAKKAIG